MITEEAVPLQVSLEDGDNGKNNYAISWGVHQILVSGTILVSEAFMYANSLVTI